MNKLLQYLDEKSLLLDEFFGDQYLKTIEIQRPNQPAQDFKIITKAGFLEVLIEKSILDDYEDSDFEDDVGKNQVYLLDQNSFKLQVKNQIS